MDNLIGLIEQLSGGKFLAHRVCLLGDPEMIFGLALADTVFALSYFIIPFVLLRLRRVISSVLGDFYLYGFAWFIFMCGASHLANVLVLFFPAYPVQLAIMSGGAVFSVIVAILLLVHLPRIRGIFQTLHTSDDRSAAD